MMFSFWKEIKSLSHFKEIRNSIEKLVSLSFGLCVILIPVFDVALQSLIYSSLNPSFTELKTSIRCLMIKNITSPIIELIELLIILHSQILQLHHPNMPSISLNFSIERLTEIKNALSQSICTKRKEEEDKEKDVDFKESVDSALSIIGLVTPHIDNNGTSSYVVNHVAVKSFATTLQRFSGYVSTLEQLCASILVT